MSVQMTSAKLARNVRRLLALCGLVVLGLPGVTNAATVQATLDQLLPGGNQAGGLTIGDKRFSNFSWASTGSAPVAARDINVTINNNDNPQRYNLQFTFAMDAFPGERTDLVICYDLDVLSTDFINRVGLRFNGAVPAGGTGGGTAASVVETVSSRDGSDVAPGAPVRDTEILDVFNDGAGPLEDTNSDFMALNLTRSLRFCKDIVVSSRPDGGYAVISIVDQIVDQVPEPGSIALIGFAGGAMLLRRRRA